MKLTETFFDRIIVGGGAAGFFAAIQCATLNPILKLAILERGNDVLNKVRISGGGRCNVTHACFDPVELIKYYPRGNKELRGPFHTFNCADTVDWFESRNVKLKTESDGRMFPVTDDSETIAQCLINEARKLNVKILTATRVDIISKENESFFIKTNKGVFSCHKIMIASGSSKSIWDTLAHFGHTIIPPQPSLFTFNIQDARIADLQGISVENVEVKYIGENSKALVPTCGPLLITHWGFSGPAILKLSAWAARIFAEKQYRFEIQINWLYPETDEDVFLAISSFKSNSWARKTIEAQSPFPELPLRLWKQLIKWTLKSNSQKNWADLNKIEIQNVTKTLTQCKFKVNGKSTFKEEFVIAGGVALNEINLKKFESKIIPGLFIAGEALDIDAVTGGFNFQAAWTGGYLAGTAISENEIT